MRKTSRLGRFREFGVWQLLSLHQFQKRIAKQEFIVPIVKPMLIQMSFTTAICRFLRTLINKR